MAIIWVDPYIGSVGGAATGTTDTTTRNGTYAAPLRFSDVYATTAGTVPAYNGISFAAGDEIRIKGLTDAQWKIPLTDSWNLTTNSPTESTFRTATKSGLVPAAYLGTWPTKRPILWVDSCPGFGGEYAVFPTQYLYDQGTYYQHAGGSTWWIGAGAYAAVMGVNPFTASLVNWDYALPSCPLVMYLFNNMPVNVSISDGWTDATTRGGKTWWLSSYAGTNTVYVGYNGVSNAGAAYLLDLANSHFCFPNPSSQVFNFYMYAAIGQTVNVGSVSGSYITSIPMANIVYSANSHVTLNTALGPAYGCTKTAWSGTPTGAVVTTRNVGGGYYGPVTGTSYAGETWKLRCLVSSSNGGANSIPAVTGQTIEFLDGAIVRQYATVAALFSGSMPTVTGVVPARTFSGVANISAAILATPAYALSQPMTSAADFIYSGSFRLDPANYTNTLVISFAAQYNFEDVYRWAALTDSRDYRSIDVGLVTSSAVAGETARGIHFATNAFDARPLALIFSAAGKAILLYNEASQNNALAFQSATLALGENFYKRLPLNLPDYAGAATGVRFDFEYATSAAFTTGEMGVYLVGISGASGAEVVYPNLGGVGVDSWTVSGVQTAPATLQYVVPKSWLTSSAITQMQVKLRFKSGSGTDKFYVRAMNLTAV